MIWRPAQRIRVLAIGLNFNAGRLLATEVLDDTGRIKGIRPPGGGVAFGETWADTLIREFDEELGARIEITGPPLVLENLYVHEGAQGHEIVFAASIAFADDAIAAQDVLHDAEDTGTRHTARWFDPDAPGTPTLYPEGLHAALHQPAFFGSKIPRG